MQGSRKVLTVAGALAVVVAATLIFILTNINGLVKAAIEKYGSEVTKTAIRVFSVSIHLADGKGSIAGLTVANPHGFSSPYVFRLDTISVRIDPSTITIRPIVIDEIRISGPQVVYEINSSGTSNIDVLKKNIEEGGPKKSQGEQKGEGKETKFIIKKFVIENGHMDILIAGLEKNPKTVTLQHIELADIGKHGGVTPTQLAQQVLTALMEEVGRDVARAGAERYLQKGFDRAVKRLLEK